MTDEAMKVRLEGWACDNCGEGWTTCWCEVRRKEQAEKDEARWQVAKANALTPVAVSMVRLNLLAALEVLIGGIALLVLGGSLLLPFFNF